MSFQLRAMTAAPENESSSNAFPVGMSVLLVDDDPISLQILESMLQQCCYHVTIITSRAGIALELLREGAQKVDLVITEVHLADISGFELLELVAKEMDIPVILMSEDSNTRLVMKGINLGASDYLLKPIRMEEVKTIWQHVIRKKKKLEARRRTNVVDKEEVKSREASKDQVEGCVEEEKVGKKRKDPTWEDDKENDEGSNPKRNRYDRKKFIWCRKLHERFVAAADTLGGPYKALPKKIHELMATEGLLIDHVAIHLQKYITVLEKSSKHNSDSKLDGSANPVSITGSASNEKLDETPDISSSGLVAIDHVDVIPCSITGSTLNQKLNGNPCFSSSGSDSSKLIDPADLQSVNNSVELQNNALESIHHPTGLASEFAGVSANSGPVGLILDSAVCSDLSCPGGEKDGCPRSDQTMEVDLPCSTSSSNECNEWEFVCLQNKELDRRCDCFLLFSVFRCLGLSK